MKNPTTEAFAQAWKLAQDGAKMKDILESTGLNYSQAWCHITRQQLEADGTAQDLSHESDEVIGRAAATLRDQDHSWGYIGVALKVPESKARRAFEASRAVRSQGLRIGRGGRFYLDEPDLYAEGLKPTGTQIRAGERNREAALASAKEQRRLLNLEPDALKAEAAKRGVKPAATWTKAQTVRAMVRAEKVAAAKKATAKKAQAEA